MVTLRLGTRASALARAQTQSVAAALAAGGVQTRDVICTTQGDRDARSSLREIGGQGVFVRELEQALVADGIDIAVHSAKDVPTTLEPGTQLGGYLPRADVRDVLISRSGAGLEALPSGARVGTSSRRRAAMLRAARPDLATVDLRGNVDTRLRKLRDGACEAIILAAAGLQRLGRESEITAYLSLDVMLPAPGQGAIALQVRHADAQSLAAVRSVNHLPAEFAVRAERAALGEIGGGCTLPLGILAQVRGTSLTVDGWMADEAGTRVVRAQVTGNVADPEAAGRDLAAALLRHGADVLLAEMTP